MNNKVMNELIKEYSERQNKIEDLAKHSIYNVKEIHSRVQGIMITMDLEWDIAFELFKRLNEIK